MADADAGEMFPVGFPSKAQCALISPMAPICVAQDHLEPVLLAHLRRQPSATVERGAGLIDLRITSAGVEVRLSSGQAIRARYLVAADGAHSTVRTVVGIPMDGPDNVMHGAVAEFTAPLWDVLGDHRYGIYGVHGPVVATFLPAGPSDRWLFAMKWQPGDPDFTPGQLSASIECGSGVPGLQPRVGRIRYFSAAAQLAGRFRQGPVFLVGDAAHRVTPRGGTGMNTAFYDGYDLGWKLGWVLRGWAGPSLLDSFQDERRPIAEHNVARSADVNGSVRPVGEELRVDLGQRMRHVWVGDKSTLDLIGPGLTLFIGPSGDLQRGVAVPDRAPVTVRRLDTVAAHELGIGATGTLLVTPDGVAVGRSGRLSALFRTAGQAAASGVS